MNGIWGHYAKWNKAEEDKYSDLTYMWNLKNNTKPKIKLKDTKNR